MDLGLKDKVALVTGASRGLGAATARQLAREGARVALSSRNAEKLSATAEAIRNETGASIIAIPGDVAQAAAIEHMVAETVKQFGGLDILVTNSGGPPAGGFDNFDDEAWRSAVNLMLMSTVRLIRCALPHLRKSSAGSVLTILLGRPLVHLNYRQADREADFRSPCPECGWMPRRAAKPV